MHIETGYQIRHLMSVMHLFGQICQLPAFEEIPEQKENGILRFSIFKDCLNSLMLCAATSTVLVTVLSGMTA
jgi:hypothetical protein